MRKIVNSSLSRNFSFNYAAKVGYILHISKFCIIFIAIFFVTCPYVLRYRKRCATLRKPVVIIMEIP